MKWDLTNIFGHGGHVGKVGYKEHIGHGDLVDMVDMVYMADFLRVETKSLPKVVTFKLFVCHRVFI